jgi:hypothetical protein
MDDVKGSRGAPILSPVNQEKHLGLDADFLLLEGDAIGHDILTTKKTCFKKGGIFMKPKRSFLHFSAVIAMLLASFLSSFFPCFRYRRLDPMEALRR